MWVVRDYKPSDRKALEEIHKARAIDYIFPDLEHPLFFVKKVAEVNGHVQGALVLKGCAETMLLLEKGKPQDTFTAMRELQEVVLREAYAKGLDEIHAAVPSIGFDKRLKQLGWSPDRPDFHLWTRSTQ